MSGHSRGAPSTLILLITTAALWRLSHSSFCSNYLCCWSNWEVFSTVH